MSNRERRFFENPDGPNRQGAKSPVATEGRSTAQMQVPYCCYSYPMFHVNWIRYETAFVSERLFLNRPEFSLYRLMSDCMNDLTYPRILST